MGDEFKTNEFRIFATLLVALLAGSEALLAYNTLYTEGEVTQGLFRILVGLNIPILLIALRKPRIGIWCALALGALLLPWQTYQNRKMVQIHEEIIGIIRHVDTHNKAEGYYPRTLDDYRFDRPWIRDHVSYGTGEKGYRISYFMNNAGTSYWYDLEGGFGYYPD